MFRAVVPRPLSRALVGLALPATLVVSLSSSSAAAGRAETPTIPWDQLPVAGSAMHAGRAAIIDAVTASQQHVEAELADCLGTKADPVDPAVVDAIVTRILERPRSLEDAMRLGFGFTERLRSVPLEPVESQVRKSERCVGRATLVLERAGSTTFASLVESYVADVLGDPAMAEARATWRACAEAGGMTLTSGANASDVVSGVLSAAVTDGPQSAAADALAKREREVAAVVAHCDREAYLPVVDRWADLEATWLERHRPDYEAASPQLTMQWLIAVEM